MWDKIKSYIPGFGFIVKVLVVLVIINAVKELVGGIFAAIVEKPVSAFKGLTGSAA